MTATPFRQFLSAYWLRPETALWRAIDLQAMSGFDFDQPSLDLGCGDGIFSFIRAGGEFDLRFDATRAAARLDAFFDKVDVFDTFEGYCPPNPLRPPAYRISCGFDLKENLLKKASALGLYDSLSAGDANSPLPFPDATFASLFSNILYWLREPQSTMYEIARVLMPQGRCCLMLPNPSLRDFTFYHRLYVTTGDARFEFLEKLDRGRIREIRHACSDTDWRQMFARAGLRVLDHHRHLCRTVIQIWDIGLRPLFPVLHKLAARLKGEDLDEIKREWIGILENFLEPLVELDPTLDTDVEPAFHCYVLEKN